MSQITGHTKLAFSLIKPLLQCASRQNVKIKTP